MWLEQMMQKYRKCYNITFYYEKVTLPTITYNMELATNVTSREYEKIEKLSQDN